MGIRKETLSRFGCGDVESKNWCRLASRDELLQQLTHLHIRMTSFYKMVRSKNSICRCAYLHGGFTEAVLPVPCKVRSTYSPRL